MEEGRPLKRGEEGERIFTTISMCPGVNEMKHDCFDWMLRLICEVYGELLIVAWFQNIHFSIGRGFYYIFERCYNK